MTATRDDLERKIAIEKGRYQIALRKELDTGSVNAETSRIADRIARLEAELAEAEKPVKPRKPRGLCKTAPRKVDQLIRQREAVHLRAEGKSYDQIAELLGVSNKSVAYKAVTAALSTLAAETREDADRLRALELARLDEVLQIAWEIAHDDKARRGERLAAVDRVMKVSERRSKLLGLDAPEKTELSIAPQDQAKVQVILERVKELEQLPDAEFLALPPVDGVLDGEIEE